MGSDSSLERLAEQAASGDATALSRLVEEVQHPVYKLALRFLGHPEDAKDASQEILVRIVTNLGSFEGRSQFMTWAYTVAVRQLMRTRKRLAESSVKDAETFAAFLDQGMSDRDFTAQEAEYRMLCAEVRLSCTYGMMLCLSRPPGRRTFSVTQWVWPTPSRRRSAGSRAQRSASGWRERGAPCAGSSPTAAGSSMPRTRAAAVARSRRASPSASSTEATSASWSKLAPIRGRSRSTRSSAPPISLTSCLP